MQITIINEVAWLCPWPKSVLVALLTAMYPPTMHSSQTRIVLHVVRDAHMAKLNAQHMRACGPTNILSFPGMEKQCTKSFQALSTPPHILVLSVDTLQRECFLYGQDFLEHTVRLLAHGLGHVLGYDHGEEMYALCQEMEQAGLSYLYAQEL